MDTSLDTLVREVDRAVVEILEDDLVLDVERAVDVMAMETWRDWLARERIRHHARLAREGLGTRGRTMDGESGLCRSGSTERNRATLIGAPQILSEGACSGAPTEARGIAIAPDGVP